MAKNTQNTVKESGGFYNSGADPNDLINIDPVNTSQQFSLEVTFLLNLIWAASKNFACK